jgi:hypothetical protein
MQIQSTTAAPPCSFRREERYVNSIEQHIAVERLTQERDRIGERVLSFFAPSSV